MFPHSSDFRKQLDLIVRKRTEAGRTIIYEFWVKELPNDTYEMIIKSKAISLTIAYNSSSVLQAILSVSIRVRPDQPSLV